MLEYNQTRLIEEVKKRPGLWSQDHVADRDEKLALWKEVGAAMFADWAGCSKATAYDRVIQMQKKWRSLRDAYRRELRARASGVRINKCEYRYFRDMSFLGGYCESDTTDQTQSDPGNSASENVETLKIESLDNLDYDPLVSCSSTTRKSKAKKRKVKTPSSDYADEPRDEDELPVPVYTLQMSDSETDSDKLFLMSFLPEMKQLPMNIKMWARAQIANVMQEAVASHYNNDSPGKGLKRKSQDNSD